MGLALGDEHDTALAAHVQDCPDCRGEVDRTRTLLAGADQLTGGVELERPPDHVWEAVRQELAADDRPRPVAARPRRPWWQPAAAAVAGLAVGVAATIGVAATNDDGPTPVPKPDPTTVARGDVTPFSAGSTTTGTAQVVRRDGARTLDVDLSGTPAPRDDYVQTWLFDPKTNEMIAIGVMDGDSSSFPIPASVDLDTYTSVDISLEPLDGNPAHSATSLARGELRPS
ncbi:MAG: anti-sigma factor [Aeromicrobium sp.]